MLFRTRMAKTKAVDEEIAIIQRTEIVREQKLDKLSQALVDRARELDKFVEEIKEIRRGQNG